MATAVTWCCRRSVGRGRVLAGALATRLLLVTVALVLLGAAAPLAHATAPGGGTATVIADSQPACLNPLLHCGNHVWTRWSAGVAVPGAFRLTPSSAYEPVLVEEVTVEREPFALTYRLRGAAVWSDGTPVSADDLLFTQAVITDPENAIASRTGHDLVVQAAKLGPKRARFVFSEPYGAWRSLFKTILPKHALEGADFDAVWQTEVTDPASGEPIGSGPFLVTARTPGESLTLSRNQLWWGPHAPFLDSITLRFIPDANAQFQALLSGEGDVLAPQPQLQIADVRTRPELVVQTAPGPAVEQISVNTGSTSMPLLAQRWFRQALAFALDRDRLYPALYGSISPDLGAQQSLAYPSGHVEYRPNFARYGYSVAAAAQLMQANGCVLGDDGFWSCGGVRASITLSTTAGSALRALVQEELRVRAAAAGFELVPEASASLFSRLPAGDYELALFAWLLGSDATGMLATYGCGGPQNWLGYCSPTATDLLVAAAAEVDPGSRAALTNAADEVLGDDVPAIPLYPRPAFLVSRATLQGPRVNPGEQGPTWNVESWFHGAFADVPPTNPFYAYIQQLLAEGITTGCGTDADGRRIYCPVESVPRQQMAAFLIRAKGLSQLTPATPTFADVPQSNPFYGHIERLHEQGITTGCGTNPLGQLIYCPTDPVPRQQMAAFLIRAKGLTQLVPETPTFADVPQSNPFYGHIERLYAAGITTGCGTNDLGQRIYCPGESVPRQQMAAFLIRAFG
jgi:peptide/nickel transport system substrate-binding protein